MNIANPANLVITGTANPANLVINGASATIDPEQPLQAVVVVHTSYGSITVNAGVPDAKLAAAVAANLDRQGAQGQIWTEGGNDDLTWLPKQLWRYGADTTLKLIEAAAITAWRTLP